MTKNVGIEFAKKHMKKMGIRFADGRSIAAAKLHLLEKKDVWNIDQSGTYLKATKTHRGLIFIEVLEQGQTKGRGLTCARLGKSNKISVSLDEARNGLLLDFRGIFKTEFADGFEDRGREAEAGK